MSFPNGSSARLDGVSPQILKDLTAKSNEQIRLNFLSQSPNKSCECSSRRKNTFPTSAVLLWCETNCAKKPDGVLRPIAVGNNFRRLSAKCAGYHVFESRQARYGSQQTGWAQKRALNWPHIFSVY